MVINMVIDLISKQVKLLLIDGDEYASNGIKSISVRALIGDDVNMPVKIQVSHATADYHSVISDVTAIFNKDESVHLKKIDIEDCTFSECVTDTKFPCSELSCTLTYYKSSF